MSWERIVDSLVVVFLNEGCNWKSENPAVYQKQCWSWKGISGFSQILSLHVLRVLHVHDSASLAVDKDLVYSGLQCNSRKTCVSARCGLVRSLDSRIWTRMAYHPRLSDGEPYQSMVTWRCAGLRKSWMHRVDTLSIVKRGLQAPFRGYLVIIAR